MGKTYLVRNFFHQHLAFEFTGAHEASLGQQLASFRDALAIAMNAPVPPAVPENWSRAFEYLSNFLSTKLINEPVVILLDELPWIHTPKSGFLSTFEHWWNSWASKQKQLKVVICGSAASWMIENIVRNRGGLHNRVSKTIRLLPFTLGETEAYLKSRNVILDQYQILQLYMAMGGIPHYLKQVNKGESATQAIDNTCFTKTGLLRTEFTNLYQSLFAHAEQHEAIVRVLAKKSKGMSRPEIIEACGFTSGGWTTRLFEELEEAGFITQYVPFEKANRDSIYKLTDEYSLFYLKFIELARATGQGTWLKLSTGQSYKSWGGFAFESVCQKHIDQIKRALGISGVYTEASGWRFTPKKGETGAQIDLLLDRKDHCINICEMKFSTDEFVIDKQYASELDNKIRIFREQTKTKKSIFPTAITTYGVKQNIYYTGRIVSEVKMGDLFKP